MRQALVLVSLSFVVLATVCQSPVPTPQQPSAPAKWTQGVVTAVTRHPEPGVSDNTKPRYDVSIKVGDTIYVVLYATESGSNAIEYRVGVDKPVLVGATTLTVNDWQGNPTKLPILRRSAASLGKSPGK